MAATQWILGIRPTFKGLQIAPVIPEEWTGFQARRIFRGATYHINVVRAGNGNDISLVVDGKSIEGNIIPIPTEGVNEVHVQGTLR